MESVLSILEELLGLLDKFPFVQLIGTDNGLEYERARFLCRELQTIDPDTYAVFDVDGSDEELMHSVSDFFANL